MNKTNHANDLHYSSLLYRLIDWAQKHKKRIDNLTSQDVSEALRKLGNANLVVYISSANDEILEEE